MRILIAFNLVSIKDAIMFFLPRFFSCNFYNCLLGIRLLSFKKSYLLLSVFSYLSFSCHSSRDFKVVHAQSLDKMDLKVSKNLHDKKKSRNRKNSKTRKNIFWNTEGIELNHFFDFKDNQLIFYNQEVGYLAWRSGEMIGESSGDWIRNVEWVGCFEDDFFILSVSDKALSLYTISPSLPEVNLANTVSLETSFHVVYELQEDTNIISAIFETNADVQTNANIQTNAKTTEKLVKKRIMNTNINRSFDLSHRYLIVDAKAGEIDEKSISFLFFDYRLVVFMGKNFELAKWVEIKSKLLEKPEKNHSYFHRIFLTEHPWFIYITFKQFGDNGLESVLVDYVDIRNQKIKESYELKIAKRSFLAIEKHRFITAAFIKNKQQYNFYYKSIRGENSFIRSVPLSTQLPGNLTPHQLRMNNQSIIGYYVTNDIIEIFEWN